MLFTREPIIETVVTARSGFRLAVRSSKYPQEELLVDAIEIVSFGSALFYRSLERPKAFLVPVSDYEVSEVRETRLVLKHLSQGESPRAEPRANKSKEHSHRSLEPEAVTSVDKEEEKDSQTSSTDNGTEGHVRGDRRRERRKQRRRRGEPRTEGQEEASEASSIEEKTQDSIPSSQADPSTTVETVLEQVEPVRKTSRSGPRTPMQLVSALIPPPPTLVSDILRYERIDNEGLRRAVQEIEAKKPDIVQEARSNLMDALDFYSSDDQPEPL